MRCDIGEEEPGVGKLGARGLECWAWEFIEDADAECECRTRLGLPF